MCPACLEFAMNVRSLAASVAVFAMPLVALAQPAAAPEPRASLIPTISQGLASAVTSLVVFGVVLGVFAVLVWPKIAGGLKDREDKIRQSIEAAESAQKQAQAQLEQYNKALADARAEAQRMLESARQQQQAQAAEAKGRADIELSNMKNKALLDIEAAKKQALTEIFSQGASLATMVASKVLQREVSSSDTQRLVGEAVSKLSNN